MRGKPSVAATAGTAAGSIPAHAGETSQSNAPLLITQVDPRACGGNWRNGLSSQVGPGRSPRMRGKHPVRANRRSRPGSIPAHAGETPAPCPAPRTGWVDPRACGGNTCCAPKSRRNAGRSPRMRGKRAAMKRSRALKGSIPAHAGETTAAQVGRVAREVDPRACGGNESETACALAEVGRSPRMRGKRNSHKPAAARLGSIPAHAGETGGATMTRGIG